ncbi:MAG TPA: patatin-like phospholipase family protein [Candidatus Paceibacterota bacterium]|nr:patatin-like phospholipase family protein [Candidatus Paceibacterota bacterium]
MIKKTISKNNRPKIGLALGGGGAKGISHVGVIKVLEENNIPIDFITGTSIGAMVGGFYSALKNISYIENIIKKTDIKKFLFMMFDPTREAGLVHGDKVIKFIRESLGDVDFKELSIPFSAVATDLSSTNAFYFEKKGDLVEAIRASISYPPIFAPVKIGNHILVDGGLVCPVPTEKVKEMGADIVIGVNLEEDYILPSDAPKSISKIFDRSIQTTIKKMASENMKIADISINPKVGSFRTWRDFDKGGGLIEIGRQATLEKIQEIKKRLEN